MESLPKKPPTLNPYKSSKSDCEEKAKMLLLHILPSATVYQQRRSARSQDCTSNTTSNLSEKNKKVWNVGDFMNLMVAALIT